MAEATTKIRFDVSASRTDPDWPPVDDEVLWGIPEGRDIYRIGNIPYYVYGISRGDSVRATCPDKDGILQYDAIERRGGHSTFRVRLRAKAGDQDRPFIRDMLSALRDFGCEAEDDGHGVLAIDAPPGCPLGAVVDVLKLGTEEDVWQFERGYHHTQD